MLARGACCGSPMHTQANSISQYQPSDSLFTPLSHADREVAALRLLFEQVAIPLGASRVETS